MSRAALRKAKRVVVKIGSSTLARADDAYERLARAVRALRDDGKSVVLVSSGAIALGTKKLGYRTRPKEMARLQAAAAAGQSVLMRAYEEAFGKESIAVAQVLLTHADLADRVRANNAREALVHAAIRRQRARPNLHDDAACATKRGAFATHRHACVRG